MTVHRAAAALLGAAAAGAGAWRFAVLAGHGVAVVAIVVLAAQRPWSSANAVA